MHLHKFERISGRFFESVRDYTSFFNLRLNLRKIEAGGRGVITKPEGLLEENKGGEGGGLELFSRSANRKNLR